MRSIAGCRALVLLATLLLAASASAALPARKLLLSPSPSPSDEQCGDWGTLGLEESEYVTLLTGLGIAPGGPANGTIANWFRLPDNDAVARFLNETFSQLGEPVPESAAQLIEWEGGEETRMAEETRNKLNSVLVYHFENMHYRGRNMVGHTYYTLLQTRYHPEGAPEGYWRPYEETYEMICPDSGSSTYSTCQGEPYLVDGAGQQFIRTELDVAGCGSMRFFTVSNVLLPDPTWEDIPEISTKLANKMLAGMAASEELPLGTHTG